MRYIFLGLFLILFSGCVKESYDITPIKEFPKSNIKVLPFANFTQNPMAGYKVAGILEGVLKANNFNLKGSLWDFEEKEYSIEDIKNLIQKANSRYIITGYVNEFKYKVGIDGEPAISITMKIFDKLKNRYIYTATFSRVGDTYGSITQLTQEGFENTLSDSIIEE